MLAKIISNLPTNIRSGAFGFYLPLRLLKWSIFRIDLVGA
jgi:hypothetical protein